MFGLAVSAPLLLGGVAFARPVVCSTSLEAPAPGSSSLEPVEVSRCGPVDSTVDLIDRRYFSWTAPYDKGVDLLHQFTGILGIAVAGPQGNQFVGFGFPDQTISWDGMAIQNTVGLLLEEQSPLIPWRTVDISTGFNSSIAGEALVRQDAEVALQEEDSP
ncbi:MAG: occludin/ELL family protein [Prochlorococcus sp.]|nr:occludin/ELL family protein [Prochlorococcus sp.]